MKFGELGKDISLSDRIADKLPYQKCILVEDVEEFIKEIKWLLLNKVCHDCRVDFNKEFYKLVGNKLNG